MGDALEKHVGKELPREVLDFFSTRGACVTSSKLLKVGFHATWLVDVQPPFSHKGESFSRAIIQIVGAQLCDKAIYGHQHLTAATLVRASDLAASAGIKVAKVFGTGQCNVTDQELGALDFIVQEFIITDTVEDEVEAPRDEFLRIHGDVQQRLRSI